MQFDLQLSRIGQGRLLTWNYQYPLSSAIYKIIRSADKQYGDFLHNSGYGSENKQFKLFTFSDLRTSFRNDGNRMNLQSDEASLRLAFHIPKAAESFIRGLFMQQELVIADKKSKVTFQVRQVTGIPTTLDYSGGSGKEITLRLLSPVVAGRKNELGNYTFLDPLDDEFFACLLYNMKSKYSAIYGEEETQNTFDPVRMSLLMRRKAPVSRLITIKEGSSAETKIRGYTGFEISCKAPDKVIELMLNSGVGLYNAQGMGCVEVKF